MYSTKAASFWLTILAFTYRVFNLSRESGMKLSISFLNFAPAQIRELSCSKTYRLKGRNLLYEKRNYYQCNRV